MSKRKSKSDDTVCRGSWVLGTACGECGRCRDSVAEAAAEIRRLRDALEAAEATPTDRREADEATICRLDAEASRLRCELRRLIAAAGNTHIADGNCTYTLGWALTKLLEGEG